MALRPRSGHLRLLTFKKQICPDQIDPGIFALNAISLSSVRRAVCRSYHHLHQPAHELLDRQSLSRHIDEHTGQLLNALGAAGLIIRMAPNLRFGNSRVREGLRLAPVQFDDADANVGAADIHREDRLAPLKHPVRQQVQAIDQTGRRRDDAFAKRGARERRDGHARCLQMMAEDDHDRRYGKGV